MAERRRSGFVLLLIGGLIAVSLVVVDQRDTKLGLDLQGGVQLVYEAEPTAQQPTITPAALQRSLDIMRERVDVLGVAEPELLQSGERQIEVNLPGEENADRAAQQVGSTAQLFFYDWEANILDDHCRTDENENANHRQAITGLFQAVRRASRCDPRRDGNNNAADRSRFYAFDAVSQRPLNDGQPSESREAALEDLDDAARERAQVVEVPEGILVVRDQKPSADAPDPDRFWVIEDDPALSGTEIRNPEQDFDQQLSNAPLVRFKFTDRGRDAFQEITRAIAQRGADNSFGSPDPSAGSQHFAIVLDDELISAPSIDYVKYPDGIDGRTGAEITGSFTIGSAQQLAKILEIGALPVRLELVSRSQVSA
jgi:SecD/SecF fusion protein